MEKEIEKIIESDMTAKEFFEGLFDLSFLSEEERETIYTATECFAKGKARVQQAHLHSTEARQEHFKPCGCLNRTNCGHEK